MSLLNGLDQEFNFSFLSIARRRIAIAFSGVLMLLSLVSLGFNGLNFGIDFTGGTLVEVGYEKSIELEGVRSALNAGGYPDAVVQHFGTSKDVLIRLGVHEDKSNQDISTEVMNILRAGGDTVDMRRVEFVGPQVGGELIEDGGLAVLYTLIGILIYVAFRFEYRFAIGSVLALVHDSVITLGFFSLFGLEFDLTVLAALLAVIGYSLNDTIVVFDRIRDNFLKMRKGEPEEIMNKSINQTLIRTLMTSTTTLLVVIALFLVGGELIHGFSVALIVGIVIGTYSSIYIASAITLAMGVSKADLMPVQKEGEEQENVEP